MNNELLPCPFCGGEARTMRSKLGYKVFCDTPFCCWIGTCPTEQEAINAWNQRAEHTCKLESCEEFDERGIWAIELSCGHSDVYCVTRPGHCSYCGAKVVD